jgi:Polyketide cyclase / dehydrase and lipid transport
MTSIRTTATIARSPAELFAYVTTSGNWPQWHPSSLRVSGTADRPMVLGDTCIEEFLVAGRRGSCTWTVRECIENRRWRIDTNAPEGYASITYSFEPSNGTTRFERLLEYRMRSPFFALLDGLVLRARIRRESEEASRRLKVRLEQPAPGNRLEQPGAREVS